MDVLLKPFAVLVTNWKSDQFFKARLKLSFLYVLIVFVIVGGVSSIFYESARRQLETFPRRFVVQTPFVTGRSPIIEITKEQQTVIEEIKQRIISSLITVDASILILVFFLSYWWAGYTLRPIKASLEQQKRFIADASHEFRTPLTVMKTSIAVFERHTTLAAPVQDLLQVIKNEIQHLSVMSTQMLDLTTADLAVVSKEAVVLADVLATIKKRFDPIATEKNISLSFGLIPGVVLFAQQQSLEHAFSNILDNALKYTEPKGQVTLSVEKSETQVAVKITDTGRGIAPHDIPFIFNRFYQGDASKHTVGAGLGLSIVKSIIENHGGTVSVQSTLGAGSTFTIFLPLKSS